MKSGMTLLTGLPQTQSPCPLRSLRGCSAKERGPQANCSMRLPAKRNRQREAGGWDAAGIGGYIYPLTHREARPNPADCPRPIGPGSLRMTPALSLAGCRKRPPQEKKQAHVVVWASPTPSHVPIHLLRVGIFSVLLGIWGGVGVIMPFRFSLTTTP